MMQDPLNSQSLNRYSYVLNNPMTYTDLTGYFSVGDGLRLVATAVIAWYAPYLASYLGGGLGGAVAAGAISGFAAGAVQTGNLKGAVNGAVSGAVFGGIGASLPAEGSGALYESGRLSTSGYAVPALTSGVAGGVLSTMQGGRFGAGFASAGLGSALTPVAGRVTSNSAGQGFLVAIVGGTASAAGGGKFANGAMSAAFSYAFGHVAENFETGSSDVTDVSPIEVPSSVKIEAQGFETSNAAAKAAGAAYGEEGVRRRQELQLGLSRLGEGNWSYLTPGWGPVGAVRVDPTALLQAYRAAGLSVQAWMHGHFDSQLFFSAVDFSMVWGKSQPTYLVNSVGQVRSLTDAQLKGALKSLPRDYKSKGFDGLRKFYEESGFPGSEL
jgi:hypothetical protein